MSRLFGDAYDKKRLAPGQITGADAGTLLHDCSTLGGNSGSAVISLASGETVALHFAGRFLEENYAVASDTVCRPGEFRGLINNATEPLNEMRPRAGRFESKAATSP